jgi:outer membrane protein
MTSLCSRALLVGSVTAMLAVYPASEAVAGDEKGTGDSSLTLAQAIERALAHDPRSQGAQARLDEATATRDSTLGNFGPRVQIDGTLFYWSAPHDMQIVEPGSVDLSAIPPSLAPLLAKVAQPIRFRDDRTAQVQVSLVQAITPLYSVQHGQRAARHGEEAAEHARQQNQRETTFRVTDAYYRVLAAQHLCQVADEAVTTLTAHLEQAKVYRDAEMLGLDEYLAVEVELGNAVENQIKAKTQRRLARAALATLMGWKESTSFVLADVPEDAEPPLPSSIDDSRKAGLAGRSELASLSAMAQASREQAKVAWWQLTPQVSALARYQHTSGTALNNPNEWFVGGVLAWNLWDWGATYYKARAAEAQVRQVQARAADAADLIDLEIQQRFLAIEAARERLKVTRLTLRQAQEAMRVARMKFEQHTVPSTTVLDSQTRLSRAEVNRVQAQYELIVAVASLRLSMGEGVSPTVLLDELLHVDASK